MNSTSGRWGATPKPTSPLGYGSLVTLFPSIWEATILKIHSPRKKLLWKSSFGNEPIGSRRGSPDVPSPFTPLAGFFEIVTKTLESVRFETATQGLLGLPLHPKGNVSKIYQCHRTIRPPPGRTSPDLASLKTSSIGFHTFPRRGGGVFL